MASVGYECQAARQDASHDLGQHVGRDQGQGDYEVLSARAPQVVGVVVASMVMAVTVMIVTSVVMTVVVMISVVMVIVFVAIVVTGDEAVVIAGVWTVAAN